MENKKFNISKNSKYYVPEEIAKNAIGYKSLGSYILSLQVENESLKSDLKTKIDGLENQNAKIIQSLEKLNSATSPGNISESFGCLRTAYEALVTNFSRSNELSQAQRSALLAEVKKIKQVYQDCQKLMGDGS